VLGLLVVIALLLCKREPRVVAIGAGRWLRAVIAAGLALGATLGIAGCGGAGIGAPRSCSGVPNDDPWDAVLAAWTEASAFPGSSAIFPTDRERILASLSKAITSIDAMIAAGRLDATEGDRLRKRFNTWRAQVAARPIDRMEGDCYLVAQMKPAEASIRRITTRLDALERLLVAERLGPPAVRAAAKSIRCELDTIERRIPLTPLPPNRRTRVEQERTELRARLDALDVRLVKSR
jgi:hypothetical protein